jgi:hypothetical protein
LASYAAGKRFSDDFYVFGGEEAVKVTKKDIHFEQSGNAHTLRLVQARIEASCRREVRA